MRGHVKESPGPERVRPSLEAFLFFCIVYWYSWSAHHREHESRRPSWIRLAPRSESKAVGVSLGYLYRWIKAVYCDASQNPISESARKLRVREQRIDPLAKKPECVMKKSWNHLWGNTTGDSTVTNQFSWHFCQNPRFHLYLFLWVETLTDSNVINCLHLVIEWLINWTGRFVPCDGGNMGWWFCCELIFIN